MEAQLDFTPGVRDQMSAIAGMVTKIRAIREQLETKEKLLEERSEATDLFELGKALNDKLNAIEEAVHNPHAEVSYDILGGRHGGAQL